MIAAYLVSKNRYSENSIIAEVFTENHGKDFRNNFWWNIKEKLKTIYKLVIKFM